MQYLILNSTHTHTHSYILLICSFLLVFDDSEQPAVVEKETPAGAAKRLKACLSVVKLFQFSFCRFIKTSSIVYDVHYIEYFFLNEDRMKEFGKLQNLTKFYIFFVILIRLRSLDILYFIKIKKKKYIQTTLV